MLCLAVYLNMTYICTYHTLCIYVYKNLRKREKSVLNMRKKKWNQCCSASKTYFANLTELKQICHRNQFLNVHVLESWISLPCAALSMGFFMIYLFFKSSFYLSLNITKCVSSESIVFYGNISSSVTEESILHLNMISIFLLMNYFYSASA